MDARREGTIIVLLGLVVVAVLAVFRPEPVGAQQGRQYTYEQLTVSTAVVSLASATTATMGRCLFAVETNGLRYRFDATAPTAGVGMPIAAAGSLEVDARDARLARFIRSGAADATLNVSCWTTP